MSRFDAALEHVLSWEGGETDDPDDPGGRTKYGISERAHPAVWNKGAPTKEQAADIYHAEYWDPCRCAQMRPEMGFYLFDTAVNVGVNRASRMLQEAVGARPDGIIGPKTLDAIEKTPQALTNLAAKRAEYYASLDMDKYLFGWMRRAFDSFDKARELI